MPQRRPVSAPGEWSLAAQLGTVAMDDERYPVTRDLKVRRVEGLRVIDASVFPRIACDNTSAPTIMIAEKGAEMVLADAKEAVAA